MKRQILNSIIINSYSNSILWDSIVHGLGVRQFKFKKSYIYRKKGSSNTITIGDTSLISISQARKHAVTLGGVFDMNLLTFEDISLEWCENWGQFHRKGYKKDDLRRLNKYILPALGEKPLKQIKGRDLILLHNRLSLKGRIEANRCLALVSAIYNKAIEWELYDGINPCRAVRKNSERGRDRVAKSDEIDRLLLVLRDHPFGSLFMLCLMCGLRRGEASRIRWEDVNLVNKTILLTNTKNGKDRLIYINDELVKRLKIEKTKSPWVFHSSITGSHIKHIRRHWKTIKYEAQIEGLTIHDLRRTFATKLVEEGVPIEHVSKALGHSSIAITQDYVHISDKVKSQVFNKASQIFK